MNGQFIRLLCLPGEGRLGVATSKSLGCHARRNRMKRRLKEAFWLAGGLPGHDSVLIAKQAASEAAFAEIQKEVQRLLAEAITAGTPEATP